jgi:hypothetical protein
MSLRQVAAELKVGVATLSRADQALQNGTPDDIRNAGPEEPSPGEVQGEDVHGVAEAA